MICLCLFLGFNVNTPLKGGWVALMYACNHGNSEIVRLLLQHGANPNTQKGKQNKRILEIVISSCRHVYGTDGCWLFKEHQRRRSGGVC